MYPGTTFTVLGSKIRQIVQGPTTETLLIIGTAQDGPLNVPVRIEDTAQAERVFGPANYSKGFKDPTTSTETGKPAGATLPLAISQALAAGNRDLLACRATGTLATGTLGSSGLLYFRAQNPGRLYNEATVTYSISGEIYTLTLGQPLRKGGSVSLTGQHANTTLSELIDRINGTSKNKVVEAIRTTSVAQNYMASTLSALAPGMSGTVTLSGGTNGCLAKGDDYGPELMTSAGMGLSGFVLALTTEDTGTFDSLLNREVRADVVVLDGINVDDQVWFTGGASTIGATSIAADFAYFIDRLSATVNPCHGIMSTRLHNLTDDSDIITYINNNLKATDFGYYDQGRKWIKTGPLLYAGLIRADAEGSEKDVFTNISICAGPSVIYNHPDMGGDYSYNFHVGYAALLTTLPPEQSATFASIPGIRAYGRPYPIKYAKQLLDGVGADNANSLDGKGAYVILTRNKNNPNGPLVVFDDPTAGFRNNSYRNYQTVHLINSINKDISAALSPFIGGPTSPGVLATMEARCQNVLDGYVNSQALRGGRGDGYNYKVTMSGQDADLGTVNVYLDLALATAMRKINIVVSVKR